MINKGKLYLVSTPIGNLQDITLRAINTLKDVDLIAAEDTRHTIKLLNHFDIKTPLTSYHEHNRVGKGEYLVKQLLDGIDIALVTDAGTPGISDPGEDIVREAAENEISVVPIPGVSAAITALSVSGLCTSQFVFEGFLPKGKSQKKERLIKLYTEDRTIVLYESPHRLLKTLNEIGLIFGADRKIVLARELTKKFEEIKRYSIKDALSEYSDKNPRGEFVILIQGLLEADYKTDEEALSIIDQLDLLIANGEEQKSAMKIVAKKMHISKSDVYKEYLNKKRGQ